ncbi:MAG: hypothetical protein E7425_06800 [Ruminococcaceae bacterium]|jgi:hypothetical protein|nr:hypothetical protein [Oscillospiraceae bacterium]
MDVKIGNGAWTPQPAGKKPPKQQRADAPKSFAALLRPETASAKTPAPREGKDFSGQTPEEVFAQALADHNNPDLDSLDDYLEWLIHH